MKSITLKEEEIPIKLSRLIEKYIQKKRSTRLNLALTKFGSH